MGNALFVVLNGFAAGMAYFLVAAGLTWVFGILRLLNFAHGAFFMFGAYVAYSIMGLNPTSMTVFLASALVAGIVVGAMGLMTDAFVLGRLREVDYHYALIATFGLMLLVEGVAKLVWGLDYHSITPPPALDWPIRIWGHYVSVYTLFVIATGLVTFAIIDLIMQRTWVGKVVRAVALDPWMAGTIGINVPFVLAASVSASFLLAGLAGGLLAPNQTLSITVGSTYLLHAFLAVVIGGLGSIRGTFLACIALGLVESANSTFAPQYGGIAIFVVLAVVLVIRPYGFFPPRGLSFS